MEPRDQWSPRHSTLMRQRALVLAVLQRGVHDMPPALPARRTPRRRLGRGTPDANRAASS
jgi:hypothetical protein